MLLRVYSNRFLYNHTGMGFPWVFHSCCKLLAFDLIQLDAYCTAVWRRFVATFKLQPVWKSYFNYFPFVISAKTCVFFFIRQPLIIITISLSSPMSLSLFLSLSFSVSLSLSLSPSLSLSLTVKTNPLFYLFSGGYSTKKVEIKRLFSFF